MICFANKNSLQRQLFPFHFKVNMKRKTYRELFFLTNSARQNTCYKYESMFVYVYKSIFCTESVFDTENHFVHMQTAQKVLPTWGVEIVNENNSLFCFTSEQNTQSNSVFLCAITAVQSWSVKGCTSRKVHGCASCLPWDSGLQAADGCNTHPSLCITDHGKVTMPDTLMVLTLSAWQFHHAQLQFHFQCCHAATQ